MKIKGKTISVPNVSILVIPRDMGEDIVFKAQAILDMEPFETLCPEPIPPNIRNKAGDTYPDLKDKKYLVKLELFGEQRMAYMVLMSLQATEDLVWDTVSINDPATWMNYKTELKDAGFNTIEVSRIVNLVFSANSLDESKYKEARERFTLSQVLQQTQVSSPVEEQVSTSSGVPAKDSV